MTTRHTPRRIACLQPSATVILDAIGELERVVACTRYCADVVPEVADGSRIILADSWTADTAEIVAAKPDLVIASVPYQEKSVSDILKAGVTFLGFAPRNLADIFTDIAVIAGAVGASDRGEEVIAAMHGRIEQVRKLTAGLARPRVFCEEWGKPVIASQTWVAELIGAAGGEFLGSPVPASLSRGNRASRPRNYHRRMVWGGRSSSPRKNHSRSRLAEHCSHTQWSRLLRSR